MPSVGRGSVRTTRQGGPPSRLADMFEKILSALESGYIRGLQIKGGLLSEDLLASLLQLLRERRAEFILVDQIKRRVVFSSKPVLSDVVEVVCSALSGEGSIPLWRSRVLIEEFSSKGLEALKRAARSEDNVRRDCASMILDIFMLAESSKEGAELPQRLLAYALGYAYRRGEALLVYRGERAPLSVYERGRVIAVSETPEPPRGYLVLEIRGNEYRVREPKSPKKNRGSVAL